MARGPRSLHASLAALFVMTLPACSMTQPTLQETRELELTVAPGSRLFVEAGAGSMVLDGDPAVDAVSVVAEIYQVEPSNDYTLTLEAQDDGSARLVAVSGDRMLSGSDRIDLSIRVPESLRVDINDGSGSLRVSGLRADLTIEDGSGSTAVSDIDGNVSIDDGSGSITVEDVRGNLDLVDGSGSITVARVGGDVDIDDGSGSISVEDAGGTVTVDDGSGSISVDGAGDFELVDDGSGSVRLNDIASREP